MSTTKSKISEAPALQPLVGALLRLTHEHVVNRMLEALNAQGYDISPTELAVFMYPGPHGMRPIEIARKCHMGRQAMNYVLTGLEKRGYIERLDGANGLARVVHLSAPGQAALALMRKTVAQIEQEWTGHLGERRFKALKETLQDLSQWLGQHDCAAK